jgi:peptidoglycan hydrolase-like protein with peptidoglycan-binding domain
MNPTLRFGSSGPLVQQLQQELNKLPSSLPPLAPDGLYGSKTLARVREFQSGRGLVADGIVGPMSWTALAAWLASLASLASTPTAPAPGGEHPMRRKIAQVAWDEWLHHGALVHAMQGAGIDPATHRKLRRGHERLMKYFSVSAPKPGFPGSTYYGDDTVRYLQAEGLLAPCKHWCGIFALWAVKTAPVGVGTWIDGLGIASVAGFKSTPVKTPRPGDIAYRKDKNHHAVVFQVLDLEGQTWVTTIDGNSGQTSTITKNEAPRSKWDAYYTIAALA